MREARVAAPAHGGVGGRVRLRLAFMGIGLVDPVLKPIGEQLRASASQVSLLFSSYLAVMGVAMLVTGAVSCRLG